MNPIENLGDYNLVRIELQKFGGSRTALYRAIGEEAVRQNAPAIYGKGLKDGARIGMKIGMKKGILLGAGFTIAALGGKKIYDCYKDYREEYDEFDPKLFVGYCGNRAMDAIERIIPSQEPVVVE